MEEEAAKALGFIYFAFSRLDADLGSTLVYARGPKVLEDLSKKISTLNFHARLELLDTLTKEKYSDSPDIIAKYEKWISDAHSIREIRNRFFHGRWGVSDQNKVSNVLGLPTSPNQENREFVIEELVEIRDFISDLNVQLADLRKNYPT